jgi:excisionase family DNA binding protein
MTTPRRARDEESDSARLWTVNELAQYLQIPRDTLYQWRQRGEGPPAVRLGKHLRYRPEAVQAWLKSQEEDSGICK